MFLTVNAAMDLCRAGRPCGINTSSLRVFYTGGERVSAELMKNLKNLLPESFVLQGYGLTEASGTFLTAFIGNSPEVKEMLLRKPESCGRPLPTMDMYKVGSNPRIFV